MMKKKVVNKKEVYELTEKECRNLLNKAKEALKYTYPEKGRGYSIALLTKSGNIYTGASYKSETESLTMHS